MPLGLAFKNSRVRSWAYGGETIKRRTEGDFRDQLHKIEKYLNRKEPFGSQMQSRNIRLHMPGLCSHRMSRDI